MFLFNKLVWAVALTIGLAMITASNAQAEDGPVVLTITGQVGAPNRGAIDPETDKFLSFFEVESEKAFTMSLADLQALPVVSIKADFPMGGAVHSFSGPLLADVLAAAGATGKGL